MPDPHVPTQTPTQLRTIAQCAEQLGLSPRTIWSLISAGKIRAIRLGGRATRIEEAEIERFIDDARRRT